MDIISVVLGADTKKDRTRDSIKIIEYAFENYQMVDIGYMAHERFDKLVQNSKFEVIKGINSNVIMELNKNDIGIYPVDKTEVKDINVSHELQNILKAPINQNDKIR